MVGISNVLEPGTPLLFKAYNIGSGFILEFELDPAFFFSAISEMFTYTHWRDRYSVRRRPRLLEGRDFDQGGIEEKQIPNKRYRCWAKEALTARSTRYHAFFVCTMLVYF